jgi:hypothetical protein
LKWFSWKIARLEFFEVAFFTHIHFFFFVSTVCQRFRCMGFPCKWQATMACSFSWV